MPPCLILKYPDCQGRTYSIFLQKPSLTVGTANEVDLVLTFPSISTKHATFENDVSAGVWHLTNVKAATYVNGSIVKACPSTILNDGDIISFGVVDNPSIKRRCIVPIFIFKVNFIAISDSSNAICDYTSKCHEHNPNGNCLNTTGNQNCPRLDSTVKSTLLNSQKVESKGQHEFEDRNSNASSNFRRDLLMSNKPHQDVLALEDRLSKLQLEHDANVKCLHQQYEEQELRHRQEVNELNIQLSEQLLKIEDLLNVSASQCSSCSPKKKSHKPDNGDTEELKEVASASNNVQSGIENELTCVICHELFVQAVTLNCAHSFCRLCINKWLLIKKQCPLCNSEISHQTQSVVIDSIIASIIARLPKDERQQRELLLEARQSVETKPASPDEADRQNFDDPAVFMQSLRDEFQVALEQFWQRDMYHSVILSDDSDDEDSTVCFNCYGHGHRASDCNISTTPSRLRGVFVDKQCFHCGQFGHIARFCAMNSSAPAAGSTSGFRGQCFRCGQRGHLARNCRT